MLGLFFSKNFVFFSSFLLTAYVVVCSSAKGPRLAFKSPILLLVVAGLDRDCDFTYPLRVLSKKKSHLHRVKGNNKKRE
jgi:hypothetical protein